MGLDRVTDICVIVLGLVYAALGVAETIRVLTSGDGGLGFWFGSLVGGGTAVLVGQLVRRRPRVSAWLVTLGGAAGVLATAWTLLVPVFAVVVIVLAWRRAVGP